MADSNPTSEAPSAPRGPHRGRGNRSHQYNHTGSQDQVSPENRGRGGGHRGGRNSRGGRGRGQAHSRDTTSHAQTFSPASAAESNSGRPPGGGFGARLTEAASKTQGDLRDSQSRQDGAEEDAATNEEVEVCFICASPIEHVSIAPCNHQTCHICSLRLRALYKTRACAHCRSEAPFVIFTDNAEKRYEDFKDDQFVKVDDNLGVKYEQDIILEDTVLLLRYNCPDRDCDVACLGWPDLHRHVRSKHGKIMCDLCTRNKKVFTHEHELFTFGDLRKHEKFGDDNPGAVDQSGFKGHPECGFCKQRFYGDDELYTHCREKHERCHICDRRNEGRNPQYYLNYQELEKHFAAEHFVCLDAECQANKTNVFESEMDLKAHQLSAHPNGLSKDARRDARLVNLSGFNLREAYQPPRREDRGGRGERGNRGNRSDRGDRGSGRGRDPNAEPLPQSSAQPIGRAELAYQRQLAIQSSQSVAGRNFGGQLTQSASAGRPQASASQPAQSLPAVEDLSVDERPAPVTNLTPQEQARALRHQAVTERATALLKNDQTKLSQFRTHVSAYRSGTSSANALIDSFFSLFDCPSSEVGKLVRKLSDLYEDETKRQALLEAWNNWRSINEDYPDLPGPSGVLPILPGWSSTTGNGRRVLTLKKSTAQSSRSAVSRQGSWGNAIANGTSRDPFPALSAANNSSRAPAGSRPHVWGNTPAPTVSNTNMSAIRSGPTTASTIGQKTNTRNAPPPRATEDLFPSLPAAARPNTMMSGFNTRGSVKWFTSPTGSGTATPVNPWGSGGTTPTPAQAQAAVAAAAGNPRGGTGEGEVSSGGMKKSKKPKKEMLFHFG